MDFDELKSRFAETTQDAIKQEKKIYELLREQFLVNPVYMINRTFA